MFKFLSSSFLLFIFFTSISFSEEKIVFIDINYIFLSSNAGKDLNLQIKNKNKKIAEEINKFKKNIESQKKELISQKNVLSEEEYIKKIKKLEKDINVINQTISKKNQEFSSFKEQIEKEFSKKLNLVIEEYSISNSISIILKKGDLLMAKNELDITNDVLKIFNEKINKININWKWIWINLK